MHTETHTRVHPDTPGRARARCMRCMRRCTGIGDGGLHAFSLPLIGRRLVPRSVAARALFGWRGPVGRRLLPSIHDLFIDHYIHHHLWLIRIGCRGSGDTVMDRTLRCWMTGRCSAELVQCRQPALNHSEGQRSIVPSVLTLVCSAVRAPGQAKRVLAAGYLEDCETRAAQTSTCAVVRRISGNLEAEPGLCRATVGLGRARASVPCRGPVQYVIT